MQENGNLVVRDKETSESGGKRVNCWLDKFKVITSRPDYKNMSLKNEITKQQAKLPRAVQISLMNAFFTLCINVRCGLDLILIERYIMFSWKVQQDGRAVLNGMTKKWREFEVPEEVSRLPLYSFQSLSQNSLIYWFDCERISWYLYPCIKEDVFFDLATPQ